MPSRPEALYKGFKPNKANQDGIYFYQQGLFADAFENFTVAAEQGDMYGQANLASLYRDGEGVQADFSKAFFWYQHAAKQGHKQARIELNQLCSNQVKC